MSKTTITIIGGGACGVAAFIELIIKLKVYGYHQRAKIIIIEREKEIGKGMAFGTNQPGHILNTQANLMGIHAYEPAHFSEWLKEHEKKNKQEIAGVGDMGQAHTTRRLYGNYLQEQFYAFYKIALAEKIEIELKNDEAENILRFKNRWQIIFNNESPILTDYLILAPGTPKPKNYAKLEGKPGYINFPWPSDPILKIPQNDRVGVLGSRLSAIDTIITMADNQHRGSITLYSPDGLLPRVQPQEENKYDRQHLTLSNIHKLKRENLRLPKIRELFALFKKEAENYEEKPIYWDKPNRIGKPADELLLNDIAIAEAGGDAFTNILYSLRHDASIVWSWLSVEEKIKFRRWLGMYWNINRHAMPLVNALRLKELFENGQLNVKPKLEDVKYEPESKNFILTYKNKSKDKVPYLINATGPADEIKNMKSILIENLAEQNLIEEYMAGGIYINPNNMQVISSKMQTENLYAVGNICNGILLDVNAVWFNVKTIQKMCDDIVQKIGKSNYSQFYS